MNNYESVELGGLAERLVAARKAAKAAGIAISPASSGYRPQVT